MRRRWVIAAWVVVGAVVYGVVAFGLSWWLIDPHLEGADEYPGGVVLRDNAGTVLRVSLLLSACIFLPFLLRHRKSKQEQVEQQSEQF